LTVERVSGRYTVSQQADTNFSDYGVLTHVDYFRVAR